MRAKKTFFILFIVALLLASNPVLAQSTATKLLLDKAHALQARGRMDMAAQVWKQILLADPNQVDALAGLAMYAKQTGNPGDLQQYLGRLRAVSPNNPAIAQINAVTVYAPEQLHKLEHAGQLAADHNPEEALRIYQEVLGENPAPGDWAAAYYETMASLPAKQAIAVARLRELAQRVPSDSRYRLSLGRVLTYSPATRIDGMKLLESLQGDPSVSEAARSAWRQALIWEKGNHAAQASLHSYLSRYPDPELEKQLASPVQPAAPSAQQQASDRNEQEGYRALREGRLDEASEKFEALRKTAPARAAAGLGFVHMKQQDFAAAQTMFEQAKSTATEPNKNVDDALETARFWKLMQQSTEALNKDDVDAAEAGFEKAVKIRPNSTEALNGLGGSLMKKQEPQAAIPVYRKLVQLATDDLTGWEGLLRAQYQYGDVQGATETASRMSPQVRSACSQSAECAVLLAAAYSASGRANESQRLLQSAMEMAAKQGKAQSFETQSRFAGLLLQIGKPSDAAAIYFRLAQQSPENVDAWQGLIASLHQSHKDAQALAISSKMPRAVYDAAASKPGFLTLMAAIYQSQEQFDTARSLLEEARTIETQNGQTASVALQSQIAGLYLQEKDYSQAVSLYEELLNRDPENLELWRGLFSGLHQSREDAKILGYLRQVPEATRTRMDSDPDLLALAAAAYASQGFPTEAQRTLRRAISQYQVARKPVPADLEIQLAWILLNAHQDGDLLSDLRNLSGRSDLSDAQTDSVEQIWCTWSANKAEAALRAGDTNRALSILTSAKQVFPDNPKIRAALAGALMRSGYAKFAFEQYQSWGLLGASLEDYRAALGTALAAHQYKVAEMWLNVALKQWKDDPKLLVIGAKLAAAQGNYAKASSLWHQALAAMPREAERNSITQFEADPANDRGSAMDNLAQLLGSRDNRQSSIERPEIALPHNDFDFAATTSGSDNVSAGEADAATSARIPQPTGSTRAGNKVSKNSRAAKQNPAPLSDESSNDDAIGPPAPGQAPEPSWLSNLSDKKSAPHDEAANANYEFVPGSLSLGSTSQSLVAREEHAVPRESARAEVEDELASIDSQFSPYVGSGAVLSGRAGQPGFDRLITQESNLEASTTVDDQVRITAVVKPVFLDSGSPDGQATLQFGTLSKGASFSPMGASGLGAEVQVATQTLGLRLGTTPQGFLVHNYTGGIQFKPGDGPINISFTRESIKDTLLSYAGVRDPGTGQIWGGAIANGLSALGSWGTSESGFYSGLGYQYITETGAPSNRRIDGSVGSYWKVLSLPGGSLTVGTNFSGMHYERNMRYFTLGQGGYFSPQSYFLFNVPVHWRGSYRDQFEYSADASLGSQHFQEDSTPYFPYNHALVAFQGSPYSATNGLTPVSFPGPPQLYYPGQVSTGANYSMNFKGAYKMTPNWYLGAFADLNNTRNYSSQSIGFYVRYLQRPMTLKPDHASENLFDWNAIRHLALP